MVVFVVGKLSDKTLVQCFQALKDEFGGDDWAFGGDANFTGMLDAIIKRKSPSYLIAQAHYRARSANMLVRFRRTVNEKPDPYYDEILITQENSAIPPDSLFKVEEILRSKIKFPSPSTPQEASGEVIGILEKEMSTIAHMHQQLLSEALELRSKYDQQELDRRLRFEDEQRQAAAKLKQMEQDALQGIEREKEELNKKREEFDFSDHMRARRHLRQQITDDVQRSIAKPVSSSGSIQKFYLISVICVVSSLASGIFAYESFESFRSAADLAPVVAPAAALPASDAVDSGKSLEVNNYLLWMLALRGFLLSAVAIGFAYYLVAMYRKSHDEDVATLRELQRYGMDINRASWIIETAMEMTTKENAKIPEKWIEGTCTGLFQIGPAKSQEVSSLAALGALMGLGPELEVGPEGPRVKLMPKSSKKVSGGTAE